MNKQYDIIAICGEAGSGKDTILNNVLCLKPQWHKIISYTTRPIRQGEQDGIDYFFESYEKFTEKLLNNEILEATVFNGWGYGTGYDKLDNNTINIGIFSPDAIETITEDSRANLVAVFYIYASPKIRLLRQLNREQNPNVDEIIRRFQTDKKDFSFKDLAWITIQNETEKDQYLAAQSIVNFIPHRAIYIN